MIIGVCGKSGSGKTYFSDLLSKVTDWEVIHVDDLVHEILETEEFINALIQKYGSAFVEEGKVNRKQLGAYLFFNIDIMESYNQFIWPWIEEKIDAKIQEKNHNLILDWMQLPLTKYFLLCDRKILLKSEKEYRKKECSVEIIFRKNILKVENLVCWIIENLILTISFTMKIKIYCH